ncbi:hypothetical protein P3T37_005673 [Kitasatospora sp. MAA4]|uniref:hypothetical protein n=1 Tax=Kitasatospora sp. MAA4 TaxID=3035093 RepID=UPI00247628F8|nr:hypothetical protein [Kitasatospora sp. MAA4]MDH6136253.1 hypothetical protein [Kitasatospora sp. MAA4]
MKGSVLLVRTEQFFERFAVQRHRLIGLALLRVVLGGSALVMYMSDYGNRELLWGPDAVTSFTEFRHTIPGGQFSLYQFSTSQLWFEVVFHLGIVVALAFAVLGGRILTVIHAVFLLSLFIRDPQLLEGGDNLARIVILFLPFATTDAYFSPFAERRRRKLAAQSGPSAVTLLHNFMALFVVFQVTVLYFVSGVWKVIGQTWYQGTSMYFISRLDQFAFSGPLTWLMNNAFAGTALSYFTIVIEVAFPLFVVTRRRWLRELGVASIEALHIGIAFGMGLVVFAGIMIGGDLACLRDDDYRALATRARTLLSRVRAARPTLPESVPSSLADPSIALVDAHEV